MQEWNRRDPAEGLTLWKLPEISRKYEIPVMRSKVIRAETKRLVLKWYTGKFPIPKRGEPIPKGRAAELRQLAQKQERLTRTE